MDVISLIMLIFALLGLTDRLLGNKIGLGKEFEKGISLLGTLVLTMAGMIVLAPLLAKLLSPGLNWIYAKAGIDPSLITSFLLANDMGGAPLAAEITKTEAIGYFNGLVIGSMMGATISFTVPFALGCLDKSRQKEFILGLLCGVVTVPVGCVCGVLISGFPIIAGLINLIPLTVFSLLLAVALVLFPNACMKAFRVFGVLIQILITVGLALGFIRFMTGYEVIKGLTTFEEGAEICVRSAVALSGAFPILFILSKLLKRPLNAVGRKVRVNETAMLGFLSSLASNVPTIKMMGKMDQKGAVLNAAFAVSASFIIADHMAFTLAFNGAYLWQVMLSKIVSGIAAVFFASLIYKTVGQKLLEKE